MPAYDRAHIHAGIAHLGVGGFHRAHQAVYVDRLFTAGLSRDWGIVGIGLMPQDAVMRDALSQQDHLYTVMTKHADGTVSAHVVASIIDYLFARMTRRQSSRCSPTRRSGSCH
ncbi:MAG TPA: hypothetical protein VES02_01635 [Dermatophilaceae bacterium]|nr:hypothetical protein [Dermatophilaceae bacterium]